MIFITCFLSNIFLYDRILKNTVENGKVFLFADTLFNNENPYVSCRKCNISVRNVAFFCLLTIYTLYIQSFWDITVDVKVQKLHNLS